MIVDALCNGYLGFKTNKQILVDALHETMAAENEIHGIAEKLDTHGIFMCSVDQFIILLRLREH